MNHPNFTNDFILQPVVATGETQTLRDDIAKMVYGQLVKDLREVPKLSPDILDGIAVGMSKIAFEFADKFLRERYESQCIKATGINLDELAAASLTKYRK